MLYHRVFFILFYIWILIDVFYNNKWMELGGSGIFRPEVTEPVGVKNPVLAWGLGLERLAMLDSLGVRDISIKTFDHDDNDMGWT